MGTEVRIGIATGLLIVIVAGVYFFYGSNRDADDLRIVTGPAPAVAPAIPAGREARPKAVASRAAPNKPAARTAAPRTPVAGTVRSNKIPQIGATAGAARPAENPAPQIPQPGDSAVASNAASPNSIRTPVTPKKNPAPAVPGSQIARADRSSVGSATSDEPIQPESPTKLRTAASSSLVDATRSNLNANGTEVPAESNPNAGGPPTGIQGSSPQSAIGTRNNATGAPAGRPSGTIALPPSLQPAGPTSGRQSGVTATSTGQAPATADRANGTGRNGTSLPVSVADKTETRIAASGWPRTHTIASGDTLSSISETYYQSSRQTDRIAKANPALDPRRLKIGDVITIPAPDASVPASASLATSGYPGSTIRTVPAALPARQPVSVPSAARSSRLYTVRQGDTLYSIASRMLGDSKRWKALFEANRGVLKNDPKRLKIGMELTLPE
ncbi:MAG TPA: LysM peptidoglycan-binding domain-containing protein [Phycisphaerae bacterium]|nr:LysM peptidoglycan-binding domain-containing protein [Phycisphaerae bacterium]